MNASLLMEQDVSRQSDYVCCLIEEGKRCDRSAGNASYGKRIQKTVQQRDLKMTQDPNSSHKYICDHHKSVIQSARATRKRQGAEEACEAGPSSVQQPTTPSVPDVDFNQLSLVTLRKYKKFYNLPNKQGTNKAQLANLVKQHFETIPVDDEQAIISQFIYNVRTNANNTKGAGSSKQGDGAVAGGSGAIIMTESGLSTGESSVDQLFNTIFPVTQEDSGVRYGSRSSTTRHGAGSSTTKHGAGSTTTRHGAGSATTRHGAGSSTGRHGAGPSTGRHGAGSSTAGNSRGGSSAAGSSGTRKRR